MLKQVMGAALVAAMVSWAPVGAVAVSDDAAVCSEFKSLEAAPSPVLLTHHWRGHDYWGHGCDRRYRDDGWERRDWDDDGWGRHHSERHWGDPHC